MHALALRRQLLGTSIALLSVATLACGSDSATNVTPVPTALAVTVGDAQTGTVGKALATPITDHLTDQSGSPVAGAVVTWTVRSGGGSVSAATSTTDANGDAVVTWTLGTTAGADSLIGTTGEGVTSIIAATAVPDAPTALKEMSGDAETLAVGAASAPLVVEAVDEYGNVVPNVTVTWSEVGDGTLSAATTTTGVDGLAQVVLKTAATPETYVVTASVNGLAPVSFTVTTD